MVESRSGTKRSLLRTAAFGVTLAIATAACGGPSDVSTSDTSAAALESTIAAPPDTTATTPPSPSTTTSTSTTTTITTSTTTSTTTTVSASQPSSTTTSQPLLPGAPTTFVALANYDLVERDVRTGEIVSVLVENFTGDAVYPIAFQLDPDRRRVFFTEWIEDSWYSCEHAGGRVAVVDLRTGERSDLGAGSGIALKPDGSQAAYLASSQCLDDPAGAGWVITPYDRVVLIDTAGGGTSTIETRTLPGGFDDPAALIWVGYDDGELLVLRASGALMRVDPAAPPAVVDDAEPILVLDGVQPVEVVNGQLYAFRQGDEGSVDLVRIDLATGAEVLVLLAEYSTDIGVAPDGQIIVAHDPQDAPPVVQTDDPIVVVSNIGRIGGVDW